jgi:hypothetical protein
MKVMTMINESLAAIDRIGVQVYELENEFRGIFTKLAIARVPLNLRKVKKSILDEVTQECLRDTGLIPPLLDALATHHNPVDRAAILEQNIDIISGYIGIALDSNPHPAIETVYEDADDDDE